MAFKAGQRYLRNKTTGAVFQYRESISEFPTLELMEANEEGELVAVQLKVSPDAQLAPSKTPEKKNDTVPVTKVPVAPVATPTLAPVAPPK